MNNEERNTSKSTDKIGNIVQKNLQAAQVLHDHGIECCKVANKTILTACQDLNIPIDNLLAELNDANEKQQNDQRFLSKMKIEALTDYIESYHHKFTRETLSLITSNMDQLNSGYAKHIPELSLIRNTFLEMANHLKNHMEREESLLFPYIRKMVYGLDPMVGNEAFKSVENPIKTFMKDHDTEAERLRTLTTLTQHYTTTKHESLKLTDTYEAMKQLEVDLYIHINLENNVLFPKALELEGTLAYR
jgi:regulator of cell morphogenesis and NO signaling